MTAKELIAELEKADPDADVYHCWYEVNESGTAWETGQMVAHLETTPAYERRGKKHNARVEVW